MADQKPGADTQQKQDPIAPDQEKNTQAEDIEQVKIMAALAYLGILFFLPLVTNPESKFGKFHANQGLMLLIASLIINAVGTIIPVIGWFLILPLGNIFLVVLFIMGLVNAFGGEMKRLPLVGNYDLIK